ncbi:MAG: hypothetical protein L0210_11565, partial [Rhodospirillales bacterium]|nr:hypothetical protein [Rhodospirillales bacterium]
RKSYAALQQCMPCMEKNSAIPGCCNAEKMGKALTVSERSLRASRTTTSFGRPCFNEVLLPIP